MSTFEIPSQPCRCIFKMLQPRYIVSISLMYSDPRSYMARTIVCGNDLCLRGETQRCHSFNCLFSSDSYTHAQVSSTAVILFNMSFPSCWNHSRLIRHVHFCTSPNACGTCFAQSLHILKSICKIQNTVDAEIPECADNSATFQHLLSIIEC